MADLGVNRSAAPYGRIEVDRSGSIRSAILKVRWQVIVIAFLLAFWEGFPFSIMGFRMVFGYQLFAAIAFGGAIVFAGQVLQQKRRFTFWEILPVALVVWSILVSFNYSVLIEPQPVSGWLPAIYSVSPLLMILTLRVIEADREDAENALYLMGVLGTVLILIDMASGIGFMEIYARGSAFTDGKIVIFKFPAIFALPIAAMRLVHATRAKDAIFHLCGISLLFIGVVVLSETRLGMAAIALALVPIYVLCVRRSRKVFFAAISPLALAPILWFIVTRYFANFQSLDSYLHSDTSANFREIEVGLFEQAFAKTHGMGFGFMSGDRQYDNVINFLQYQAGYYVGTGDYGAGLVDIGLYAALYQYGYIGLALTLLMTAIVGFTLIRSRKMGPLYAGAAGCGVLVFTFLPSPIPLNLITIIATSHVGAVLWFMAAESSADYRVWRANRRARYDRSLEPNADIGPRDDSQSYAR